MPLMISPRNYTLRTTSGHVIRFKADEPTYVPDYIADQALAVNILPVDGKALADYDTDVGIARNDGMNPVLREALVLYAIADLLKENDSAHFDGGGRPKAASITERSGVQISATERNTFWDKYRDIVNSGQELPKPPNLDLVFEAQQLNTKKDLTAFLHDIGVAESVFKGMNIRELKQLATRAAANYNPRAVGAAASESTLDEA